MIKLTNKIWVIWISRSFLSFVYLSIRNFWLFDIFLEYTTVVKNLGSSGNRNFQYGVLNIIEKVREIQIIQMFLTFFVL